MAKNFQLIRSVLLFVLSVSFCAPSYSIEQENCIVQCAEQYLHVREATSQNDGPEVEMFLKSVGLGKGYSWCSAFVHYILDHCGVKNTVNAWSPTAHNPKNVIYHHGKFYSSAEPGDVFTIWSLSKKRIAHTGFVHTPEGDRFYTSIEGNTNDGGSFNGDGVYKRRRSYKQTYSITRWRK